MSSKDPKKNYALGIPEHLKVHVDSLTKIMTTLSLRPSFRKLTGPDFIQFVFPDLSHIQKDHIISILRTPWLRDVVAWNMKNSETAMQETSVSQRSHSLSTGDTFPLVLQPIVAEAVFYKDSDTSKNDPSRSHERIAQMFRDDYSARMKSNAATLEKLSAQIPLDTQKMQVRDPVVMDVIRKSISFLLIEFSEEEPYLNQCDSIMYKCFPVNEELYHCITIKNPPSFSLRKISYILETYVTYIKDIQFNTTTQPRTNIVSSITLSIFFIEKNPKENRDSEKPRRRRNLYMQTKEQANRFSPYSKP